MSDDSGDALALRQEKLLHRLRGLDSLLVAFSGGADSAYLAWAGHTALGERALAVTALSPSFSGYDREQAETFVRHTGIRHAFVKTHEFENPLYVANNADRCYHCKAELFTELARLAAERSFAAVAYGVNADDMRDFRPGHRAAVEHRVLAPLLDAGLTKAAIRELSRRAGLPTWDRPASPCLSSRLPYGTPVTREALDKIERAEALLRQMGFRQFRVRYYGETARIEIAREEIDLAKRDAELLRSLAEPFREIGFTSVTLDPEGYRQGSLNAALKRESINEVHS
jgi:uncharacterized protein